MKKYKVIYKKEKYSELDKLAKNLSDEFCYLINETAKDTKSQMAYKTQYVLEEVIKRLQERV
jgi:hypothetical protein